MALPSWMADSVKTKDHGENVADPPNKDGGAYLTISGRKVNKDLSLGGIFSHRRSTVFWFPTEAAAVQALQGLGEQENAPHHDKKPEIDLRTPGLPEGTCAWVEPRRW